MAKQKSGSKIWIAGAVLGSIAGAAYALFKTPMSGQELRSKLSTGPVNQQNDAVSDSVRTPGMADKVMSKVEHTLAPIVGVELGKTADGPAPVSATPPPAAAPVSAAPPPVEAPEPASRPAQATAPEQAARPVQASTPAQASAPEQAAEAHKPVTAVPNYGNESIRAKRFAWGDPAPEANTEAAMHDSVPAVAPAATPEAQPVVQQEVTTSGGSESIRGNRFAWGAPAPESDEGETGVVSPVDQPTEPIAPVAENSPLEPVSSAASTPGTKMRQFPKLGGLED